MKQHSELVAFSTLRPAYLLKVLLSVILAISFLGFPITPGTIVQAASGAFAPPVIDPLNLISSGDGTWLQVSPVPQTTSQYWGAACPSATHCFAVGQNGTIAATIDGGNTWTLQASNTTEWLWGITCLDTNNCYAVGGTTLSGPGAVVFTNDGGATWTVKRSNYGQRSRGIGCVSVLQCTVVNELTTIFTTSDGGNTWNNVTNPSGRFLYAITCIPGSTRCFAAGSFGTIMISNDSGTTWTLQTSNTTKDLYGVECLDINTCYAAGFGGVIAASTNGGATWTVQIPGTFSANDSINTISCVNALNCFAVGNGGLILATSNGGINWTRQDTGIGNGLLGVSCARTFPPYGCVAAGYNGTLLVKGTPGYGSTPAPSSIINVGSNQVGISLTATLVVTNTGNATLIVTNPVITGANAGDFSIVSPSFPFNITYGGPVQNVVINCNPGALGLRTATLQFSTNDPLLPTVSYTLNCTGIPPNTPGYGSTPAPNSTISLGTAAPGSFVTTTLSVYETGTAALTVSNPIFGGNNPSDFSLDNPAFQFTIQDGGPAQAVVIRCTPSTNGSHTATLTFTTNDPSQPTVAYNLACNSPSKEKEKDKKGAAKADIVAQLRVTPDRYASDDPTTTISYTLTIKNIGPGRAGGLIARFPIDPNLTIGYASFNDSRMWVSAIITTAAVPYVEISLPPLDFNQSLSGSLIFRPVEGARPGGVIFTRYWVGWDDDEKSNKKVGSNAVRFSLSTDGTSRDDTGGAVQLFDPTLTTLVTGNSLKVNGDFFAPGELVNFWYTGENGESVALGIAQADEEGKISFEFEAKELTLGQTGVLAGRGNRSEVTGSTVITIAAP